MFTMQQLSKIGNFGRLCRLNSAIIPDYFSRFDMRSNSFVPNEIISYQFPNDNLLELDEELVSFLERKAQLASTVVSGVRAFASHLQDVIRQNWSRTKAPGGPLLESMPCHLAHISEDIFLEEGQASSTDISPRGQPHCT